ncbi:MAG: hypothetical protein B7Y99_12355 [Caulobacterales bacterium 32-69-10]|nr:MAG: hypothetical protein B7Y99_12355 [Caulobacterales bacterium 32-69-10]
MTPIGIGLDILLITLLVTALTVGLRLNKRLKAMREGQDSFVKAVGDLDSAATRAQSALVALRAASEDAHDELLTRIETARGLIVKLDRAADIASRAAAAAQAAPIQAAPPVAALHRGETRLDPRPRGAAPTRLSNVRPAVARSVDEDLFEAAPSAPAAPAWRAGDRR